MTQEAPNWTVDKTSSSMPLPGAMRAWVPGDPREPTLETKPTSVPGNAEALVRIDAVAICAALAADSASAAK